MSRSAARVTPYSSGLATRSVADAVELARGFRRNFSVSDIALQVFAVALGGVAESAAASRFHPHPSAFWHVDRALRWQVAMLAVGIENELLRSTGRPARQSPRRELAAVRKLRP